MNSGAKIILTINLKLQYYNHIHYTVTVHQSGITQNMYSYFSVVSSCLL